MTKTTMHRFLRAASPALKWQIAATVALVSAVLVVGLSGQTLAGTPAEASWWTPSNLLSLGVLVYGVGATVQQSRDLARRVRDLERNIPNTYVRRDVFEAVLERRDGERRQQERRDNE